MKNFRDIISKLTVVLGTLLLPTIAIANMADSQKALDSYFSSFEKYEDSRIKAAKQKYDQALRTLNDKYAAKAQEAAKRQIKTLETAVEVYRNQLEKYPNSSNRPNVMLNLAITLNQLIDLVQKNDLRFSVPTKYEVISLLEEIEKSHPNFREIDKVLYLKALTAQRIGEKEKAFATWRKLSATNRPSNFPVYASLAAGDYYFDRDDSTRALRYFEKAKNQHRSRKKGSFTALDSKIEYRITWAAYRAGKLPKVKKSSMKLLAPGIPFFERDIAKSIQADAVELLASALFETQNLDEATDVLKNKSISNHAPAIALNLIKKYHGVEQHQQAIQLANISTKRFGLAPEYPQILSVQASAYEQLKFTNKRISTLEKAALLLPTTSLWRHRNKDRSTIKAMEQVSSNAAKAVGIWYFENGLANEDQATLLKSASMFKLLTDYDTSSQDFIKWKLRRAHALLYADKLSKADRIYKEVKTNLSVTAEELQISSYQLVITRERQWRKDFNISIENEDDKDAQKSANLSLSRYAKATTEFVDRYPNQSRSLDLILTLASAYRDHAEVDKAHELWQRVLVSSTYPEKRTLAIRGIIYSHIENKNLDTAIDSIKKFLTLEDWDRLGNDLKEELLMVLSSLLDQESKDLIDSGKIESAANMMVETAKEVTTIPDHDKYIRDGAYNLAIAGKWEKAEQVATDYMKKPKAKYKDDALYLVARSQEYQLNFSDASKNYYKLARNYPKHSRAYVSLERAESLAVTEQDYKLAGKSAELLAKKTRNNSKRYSTYMRSADHYIQAGQSSKAFRIAEKATKMSKSKVQKLEGELLQARILFMNGQINEAENIAEDVIKKANRMKPDIGRTAWAKLVAQSSLIVAENVQKDFDTYHISGTSLTKSLSEKSLLFEKLYEHYIRTINTDDPDNAPKARFLLARSSTDFSSEIARELNSIEDLQYSKRQAIEAQAERLNKVAKKLHGENILSQSKNPNKYRNNPWIKKSLAVSGLNRKIDNRNDSVLPNTINFNIPSSWRM